MAKLYVKVVIIEAPLPFTDAEAEAFLAYVDLSIDTLLAATVTGIIDAARSERVPLADVASVTVRD